MAVTATHPLTRDHYEQLPESNKLCELIGGELHMAPAPNRYHQEISKNLEFIIHQHVKSNRLGKVYNAPFDVYLGEHDVFQPDLLFVSQERRHVLTHKGAEGAPDLVIEILSPKTAFKDRHTKLETYAKTGVVEYWLIDPEPKTIEVFLFEKSPDKTERIYTVGVDSTITSTLLPGLQISLEEVFSDD